MLVNKFIIGCFVNFLTLLSVSAVSQQEPEILKFLWERFKSEYGKKYQHVTEENNRFAIFLENLKLIDARNDDEIRSKNNVVHGLTHFSDLTQEEFESRFLTFDSSLRKNDYALTDSVDRTLNKSSALVDWTGVYTTGVKDQVLISVSCGL
jgi:hypothetical protein